MRLSWEVYFSSRGMVVARPEYRIRDLDGSLPHESAADGISVIRWFKARAARFGVDSDRVAAGGGSAGGCMASIVGTIDYGKFAELGYVGKEDDKSISPQPCLPLSRSAISSSRRPRPRRTN